MDPNQTPPSEREWTLEEQDEFYKNLGDSILSGGIANAPVSAPSEPLTLAHLLKIKAEMDAKLAEIGPLPFKNGADMSQETWEALKKEIPPYPIFQPLATVNRFMGVDIHIRLDIPFGEARECTCELLGLKFKARSPRHIFEDKTGDKAYCGGPGLCKWCDALAEEE